MSEQERDQICGGWRYDPVSRELAVYERKGKEWSGQPLESVRLTGARNLGWYRWSQQPAQPHHGGQATPASLSRIVLTLEDGSQLALNENDRDCAEKLVELIARETRLEVEHAGGPGRTLKTTPQRDTMGRIVARSAGGEVTTDFVVREITVTRRRFPLRRNRRNIPFSEVRGLELAYEVKLPFEEYRLEALVGPEEERLPLVVYRGWEGWALPGEWQEYAGEFAGEIGVALRDTREG